MNAIQISGLTKYYGKRPAVDIKRTLLSRSARERASRFVLVVAAPVHMIEGEVSHRAPTIRNQYGWRKSRHSFQQVKYLYANLRKIKQITISVHTSGRFLFTL